MPRLILLTIAPVLLIAGTIFAQERVPLPPPDPGSASALPPSNLPNAQAPATLSVPPQPDAPRPGDPPPPPPYASAPYPSAPYPYPPPPPYGPPPYGPPPYPAPPFALRDPVNDPTAWAGVEGLLWWSKSQPLSVPVVTTGPASQGANAGNLGMPGTVSLNQRLNYGTQGGISMFGGGWLDTDHTIGVNGSFFVLSQQSASFGVSDRGGSGNFVINEPFTNAPFSTLVSAPGVETGNVQVGSSSRFGGADLNVQYNLYRDKGWTINVMGGYRFLELDETLTIAANSTLFTTTTYTDNAGDVLATAPPGSVVNVIDSFRTRNQFNGGQVGGQVQYLLGRWAFGGTAKVAIGDMHETITIDGNTYVNPAGGTPVPLSGGNYATIQAGRYAMDHFAFAPEGKLTIGYAITPNITGQIGYNFLYVSSVARPGNQIDNSFDGVTHPTVPFVNSSYWSQGITAGLQFRF